MRLRIKETAAVRRDVAARLTTRRVPRASDLSPYGCLGIIPATRRSAPRFSTGSCPVPLPSPTFRLPSRRCRRSSSVLLPLWAAVRCEAPTEEPSWPVWSSLSWFPFCPPRRNGIHKTRQVLPQLLIALGDPLLVGSVHLYFLLQYKKQFRTPVALQAFDNFLTTGTNSRIAKFRYIQRRSPTKIEGRTCDRAVGGAGVSSRFSSAFTNIHRKAPIAVSSAA